MLPKFNKNCVYYNLFSNILKFLFDQKEGNYFSLDYEVVRELNPTVKTFQTHKLTHLSVKCIANKLVKLITMNVKSTSLL